MRKKKTPADDTLKNISLSELLPKAVQTIDLENNGLNIANATKTGYLFCPTGGVFDMSYPNSRLRRGRVQGKGKICPTLTCNPENLWVIEQLEETPDSRPDVRKVLLRIRHLTERECFRLMGLEDAEINLLLAPDSGLSRAALYKMSGNSIVVDVLHSLFESMFIEPSSPEPFSTNALF